jgi:VWFA-related protein
MKLRFRIPAVVLAAALLPAAQPPSPVKPAPPPAAPKPAVQPAAVQPVPQPTGEEPLLRITVTLVQVDAVVTDSKGRHVTDLKPEDFEVRQDGKVQKITHFSYIRTGEGEQPQLQRAGRQPQDKTAPQLPPVPLKASQVRRTVALVVDDLGLSFESIAQVRSAIKKWVDEQMQPGDLVAVLRTGAGMGALQQFTSDKRMLYAAIDRIKWNFRGRVGVSSFGPINEPDTEEQAAAETTENEFMEEYFSVGTLGAINYVVQGLRDLPGRKAVVIFSENIPILQSQGMNDRIMSSLEKLTDMANRAAVALYTIDPRGLPTLSFTAADRVRDPSGPRMGEIAMNRSTKYFESQNGLNFLAQQTGGMFIHDTNDIARAVQDVVRDLEGYYLIGYTPEAGTWDADPKKQKFHRVSVRVLRPGLTVRSRSGFIGTPDTERPVQPRSRAAQIAAALTSPFGATGVRVKLTSLFTNTMKLGSFVRSLLYIDASNLKFVQEEDGWYKAVVDIVTMTFGDNGQEVDRNDRTYTIRMRGETYKQALKQGFLYTVNHPVKKAGAFQMRAVVRDVATERTGSASQFIEVPDVKKGRLALSSIVLKAAPPEMLKNLKQPLVKTTEEEGKVEEYSEGNPAVRRFRRGDALTYGFQVFNARIDGKTKQPTVETQLRLYRDGKLIFTGKPAPVLTNNQTDLKRLISGGLLRLGPKMLPGEYILQIVATDKAAKENDRYRRVSQWIDFEVVN